MTAIPPEINEAILVDRYRRGNLSHGEFAKLLDTSRSEVDAILKRHNVTEDLPTRQELSEQVEGLRRLLAK